MQVAYTALESHPMLSTRIHLLPPSSWHMTIFDGFREKECEPGMWPEGKEKEELTVNTHHLSRKLIEFGRGLEAEGLGPPYRMRVQGFPQPWLALDLG